MDTLIEFLKEFGTGYYLISSWNRDVFLAYIEIPHNLDLNKPAKINKFIESRIPYCVALSGHGLYEELCIADVDILIPIQSIVADVCNKYKAVNYLPLDLWKTFGKRFADLQEVNGREFLTYLFTHSKPDSDIHEFEGLVAAFIRQKIAELLRETVDEILNPESP